MNNIFTKTLAVLTIVSLSSFSNLKAQYQMPNSGFETFQTGFNGVGEQPTGWYASNVSQMLGITGVLVGSASGRTGGNCVYLHNEDVGAMGITAPAYAYISLGKPWNNVDGVSANSAIGGCTGGLNFTYRPDTMEVWIKRTWTSQENARLLIYLWSGTAKGNKYISKGGPCLSFTPDDNDVGDVRKTNTCGTVQYANLIGEGEWVSTVQYPNWSLIKVPVKYFNNDIPQKINIFISAANYPTEGQSNTIRSGSKLWADDLRLVYSSKAHQLRINTNGIDRILSGFNQDTLSYTYSLGLTATEVPSIITAFRSGRQLSSSEVSISHGVIDGAPTTITITAEDGSSSTTYKIYFKKQLSGNSRPSNILVNGIPIQNFNGNVYLYNVSLPYGTTSYPVVTVETADDGQTYEIIPCTSLPGSAVVKVTAANGNGPSVYTINFTVAQLNDNTLRDIKINGVSIPNFRPTVNNYTVELPIGTTQVPTIEPISAYPAGEQTINVIPSPNGLLGTSEIKVSSVASSERVYRINFEIAVSSYAYLNDIKIGGVSLENFTPEVLTYNYVLPRHTTILPQITWTKGEENQNVSITYGGVNGTTTITVKAQNETAIIRYYINFSVFKSENSLLNNIFIDGESIPNFSPEILDYVIELPSGTVAMPVITAAAGDIDQDVRITPGGLNGTTNIRVYAENRLFSTTYTVRFSIALSANSQLNAILVDGEMLDGFSPEILNYNYILPGNSAECPNIDVVKATAGQQVFITKPALTGIATIKVTSETADGENVYTINFQFQLSDNNFLDYININGAPLAGFSNAITSYSVNLPPYSPVPVVEYLASDSTSKVLVIDNGLNGVQIAVAAQNGAVRTFSINYNVAPTDNVNLANIEIWDNSAQNFVSLAGFDAQITDYEHLLSWRTNTVPAINPVAAERGQVISVFYKPVNVVTEQSRSDTTEIQVVAPNGINQKSYFIYFPVEKSNYRFLSSITVDGADIADFPPYTNFNPQIFTYNIKLPYGTNQIPQVAFDKGKINNQTVFEQVVEITAGNLNEPYKLKVTAENGSTQTYTLNFSIDMSDLIDENYLNNIFVGDIPVANFDSKTFEYSVVLPYGTTALPELTFLKRFPEQTIVTDLEGVWGSAKIKVFSNINGVAATEYKINFSVSDIPTATLNSVSFTNVAYFSGFDPKVNTYIVSVTAQPEYSYTYDTELFVYETFSNHKKLILEVEDAHGDRNIYTFWYYYLNDIIPNPSFENWSNTRYNSGRKPTNWNAPADFFDKIVNGLSTYTSGSEVAMSTDRKDGAYSANLKAVNIPLAGNGHFPGIITLGNINADKQSSGLFTVDVISSVDGGINFKNTPDALFFDYKWSGSTNMRALVQLWNTGDNYSEGQKVSNALFTGSSTSWTSATLGIGYSGANNMHPKKMNITLNSSNSENAIEAVNNANSLFIDNLSFGYNSTLTNIFVNGVAVPSFNGNSNNATFDATVPAETMAPPIITFVNKVPDQQVTVSMGNEIARQRLVSVLSTAENNATKTLYNLVITRPVATINTLDGIDVGGVPIQNFNPNTFEYFVPVSNGTIFSPDIYVRKGEGHQNIFYSFGKDKVIILVEAENGTQQTYTVNFVEQTNDDATLHSIDVEGYVINFNAQTTEYQVVLPSNTQNIPNIFFKKQNEGQRVTLKTSGTNGTSVVRVEAQDGVHFTEYKIRFSTLPVVTSHLLSGIFDKNIPINGFVPTTFNYSIPADNNSKFVFQKEFAADTMTVVYFDDSIKCQLRHCGLDPQSPANAQEIAAFPSAFQVAAMTEECETTYTLIFKTNNAYLADIAVNGTSISNFQPNQFVYTVNYGGTLSDIVVKSGAEGQTITYIWNENSINITVVAADGITQNDYTITLVPSTLSACSLLKDILIDGASISLEGFVPNVFNYSVVLSEGTIYLPVIQIIKGETNQKIAITTNGVNGATIITVTAQNGSQSTYTINFTVKLSDNAFLSEILINGVLIDGFMQDLFDYSYLLPYGTTSLPVVDYTKSHPRQTVLVQPNGVNGNCIITVTSESELFANQYVIAFATELSPNAYLETILSNGIEIQGFFPEILEYRLILPYGTTEVPEITWIKGDENQRVVPTFAATLNDTTSLLVTAENGINQNIYRISFEVSLSNNALLADIFINSEPLRIAASGFRADYDFDPETFEYEVTLPYGTTQSPTVTWVGQVADYNSITFTAGGIDGGYSKIEVISQDGRVINEYSVKFIVGKSSNSALNSIFINGVLLEGFHSDTVNYIIYYPIGTQESELISNIDDISFVRGDEHQIVDIRIDEEHSIILVVTAQDDNYRSVYEIKQIILKSDNALLADIIIDGKSLKDFEPTMFDYVYLLPYSASAVPDFVGVKQEESQTIDEVKNLLGDISYIFVTAEDGSENIYTIKFINSDEDPSEKATKENVCFRYYSDGVWMFTSDRNNVSVMIFDTGGRLIFTSDIPLSDPNNSVCESEIGTTFRTFKKGQIYVYMFVYNKKSKIDSGKFLH